MRGFKGPASPAGLRAPSIATLGWLFFDRNCKATPDVRAAVQYAWTPKARHA